MECIITVHTVCEYECELTAVGSGARGLKGFKGRNPTVVLSRFRFAAGARARPDASGTRSTGDLVGNCGAINRIQPLLHEHSMNAIIVIDNITWSRTDLETG